MSDLVDNLENLIKTRKLSGFKEVIAENARESIALIPKKTPDSEIAVGDSKLGGCPDVPGDFVWPQREEAPLSFIAQVNFKQLALRFKNVGNLPQLGIMSIFYDDQCWGFKPEDKSGFKVYLFDQNEEQLTRTMPPDMKPKKVLFGLIEKKEKVLEFQSARLGFEKFLSLPPDPEDLGIVTDADCDEYYELIESIDKHHRLLGYSEPIQSSMEIECQLVTSGIDCGSEVKLPDDEMKKHEEMARAWQLLLQIDSDCENTDMMWGDGGRLYFWIKTEDLKAQHFEKIWMISQCF